MKRNISKKCHYSNVCILIDLPLGTQTQILLEIKKAYTLKQRHYDSINPPALALPSPSLFYTEGQKTFSVKNQIVNIFIFADHMISIATIPLCHGGMKRAIENK